MFRYQMLQAKGFAGWKNWMNDTASTMPDLHGRNAWLAYIFLNAFPKVPLSTRNQHQQSSEQNFTFSKTQFNLQVRSPSIRPCCNFFFKLSKTTSPRGIHDELKHANSFRTSIHNFLSPHTSLIISEIPKVSLIGQNSRKFQRQQAANVSLILYITQRIFNQWKEQTR